VGGELLEASFINESERAKAYEFWKGKLGEKAGEHKTGGIDSEAEIRKKLDLPENKKILLLLGQVKTDASIIMDSNIYQDPVEMITDVTRNISRLKEIVLLIRLHPKEFSGSSYAGIKYDHITYRELRARKIDEIPNVKIVESPEISTYELMNMASCGITINSQAGLEMCLSGKPVLVCGNAFYGRKGFTVDLGHRSAMRSCLEFMAENAILTGEQHKLALSFFYLFWKRSLFDKRLSDRPQRLEALFRL
jgi:capsule polysaccharide modification protein KpsS